MKFSKIPFLKNGIFSSILILFLLLSCIKEDDYYSLNNPNGLRIQSIFYFDEIKNSNIEADGISKYKIKIKIHPESTVENRQLGLETSLGLFENGRNTDTVEVSANGEATFYISSTHPGEAKITAKVKTFIIDTIVNFIPALPHDLLISLDRFKIDTTQSIEIRTSLFRDPFMGEVSNPIKIFYSIIPDSIQSNSLVFPALSFSENDLSSISITNPFSLKGGFKVEVKTLSAKSDTIKRIANFKIE